ncbi:COG2426 family protein [Faecalimicrobium sp. JNUCC 81]
MEYIKIMILSMIPITELRGAIPIGIALNLNPIGVYIASVIGSTLVSIPLILTFRHIIHFLREISMFEGLVKKVDRKIDSGMRKLKNISIVGIILFVGVPLPTTGTWTASAIASILKLRLKNALFGVLIGNMMSGIIVSAISLHLI